MKEAGESEWLRSNGSSRRTGFGCSKERLLKLKSACSRTIQTPTLTFLRGAHHRRCAREGLTGDYDAVIMGEVANRVTEITNNSPRHSDHNCCFCWLIWTKRLNQKKLYRTPGGLEKGSEKERTSWIGQRLRVQALACWFGIDSNLKVGLLTFVYSGSRIRMTSSVCVPRDIAMFLPSAET